MQTKWVVVLALALVFTGTAVADALVVTDEEQIENFLDLLTGEVEAGEIDDALRFTDPAREVIEARFGNRDLVFEEGDEVELARMTRDAFASLSSEIVSVQRSIQIDGDHAEVGVRVRADDGLIDAHLQMRKHGDGWLVRRVRIQ